MKHLVFVIHGIGKNGPDWSEEIVKCLKDTAKSLPNTADCKGMQIAAELDQIKFIPLYYDDLLQKATQQCFQQKEETIAFFKTVGLGPLAELFTTDTNQESFVRDNIFDVMVYRLYPEHRAAIQRMILKQIKEALNAEAVNGGLGNVKRSFLAHSLGTVVTHDVLDLLATEDGEFSYEKGWYFDNIFMLANVSALAHTDSDPSKSFVRPYLSPNRAGYVRNYYDIAHSLDPVAQVFSYKSWMKDAPGDGYSYLATNHYYQKNIHGYTHYLKSPRVYVPLLFGLLGNNLFSRDFVRRVIQGEETLPGSTSLAPELVEELVRDLSNLLKDRLPWDTETFFKACLVIHAFLKRVQ